MLNNVYILHIDEPSSLQCLNDCVGSCSQYPGLNVIPVQGYKGANYKDICEEFGLSIIPFYVNQMETIGDTLNKAFSCTAGHIKIWKMIIESGEPGVVLEHDAMVVGPLSNVDVDDDEILWLGPRINHISDYKYPWGAIPDYIDVDRWEGTHAYAITPKTARYLLDQIKQHGLNDSIDGQLGMRNIFDMKFVAVDPPPVVAVVGNRQSCIEGNGKSGFWNAINTPKYLANVRPGCEIAPERKLLFTDVSFDQHINVLDQLLPSDGSERSVLVTNGYEGRAALWLSNRLLRNDESMMQLLTTTRKEQLCRYNTYFSKYYYKINTIALASTNDPLLLNACDDPDVRFDVVYTEGKGKTAEDAMDCIISWNLLKDGGIVILDKYDPNAIKNFIRVVGEQSVIHDDGLVILKK